MERRPITINNYYYLRLAFFFSFHFILKITWTILCSLYMLRQNTRARWIKTLRSLIQVKNQLETPIFVHREFEKNYFKLRKAPKWYFWGNGGRFWKVLYVKVSRGDVSTPSYPNHFQGWFLDFKHIFLNLGVKQTGWIGKENLMVAVNRARGWKIAKISFFVRYFETVRNMTDL